MYKSTFKKNCFSKWKWPNWLVYFYSLWTQIMSKLPDQTKKPIYNDFFGILNFFLAFLKPNCNAVVLFVIAEVFRKWKNANEKIFSDPVMKNLICGFHGYVTAKLKCWLSFKNLNEQMVSDTRKFHFSSSSNALCVQYKYSMLVCSLKKSF